MLLEVILLTIFLKSEIRKVQLEARDIPLHACIFGMSYLYACSYRDSLKITKVVVITLGDKNLQNTNIQLLKIMSLPVFRNFKKRKCHAPGCQFTCSITRYQLSLIGL